MKIPGTEGTRAGEKRHTIIAEIADIDKVKYIAWYDRIKEKEVYISAIKAKIKAWEDINGVITSDHIKQAKKDV